MKRFSKKSIIASALALGFVGAILGYQIRGNRAIQPYVEKNLARVIESQERNIGIKHFGIPNVRYRNLSSSSPLSLLKVGEYEPEEDTIYITSGILVTPENNLENILAKIFTFGLAKNVETTLGHELGHFYVDKLNKSLGAGNWKLNLRNLLTRIIPDGYGRKVIGEGIAEYFRIKGGKQEDKIKEHRWPQYKMEFLDDDLSYKIGYQLVKPIIDKYGRKGMEYLISNPPSNEELLHLQTYQQRILEILSKNK